MFMLASRLRLLYTPNGSFDLGRSPGRQNKKCTAKTLKVGMLLLPRHPVAEGSSRVFKGGHRNATINCS